MNGTPEEVAGFVRAEVGKVLQMAKLEAIGAAVGALVEDGQPLAAFHVLGQSGVSNQKAHSVMEELGVGADVLDLIHLPNLSERADE